MPWRAPRSRRGCRDILQPGCWTVRGLYRRLVKASARSVSLTGYGSGPAFPPRPALDDVSWFEEKLRQIQPGSKDPRLTEWFIELTNIRGLTADVTQLPVLQQPPLLRLLHCHLPYPEECRAAARLVGSLHGRVVPPSCSAGRAASAGPSRSSILWEDEITFLMPA